VLLGDIENLWLAGGKDALPWQSFCSPIHDLIHDETTKLDCHCEASSVGRFERELSPNAILGPGGMIKPWEPSVVACLAEIRYPARQELVRSENYEASGVLSVPGACVVKVFNVPLFERLQGIVYVDM
jgi:hypothetical protein